MKIIQFQMILNSKYHLHNFDEKFENDGEIEKLHIVLHKVKR